MLTALIIYALSLFSVVRASSVSIDNDISNNELRNIKTQEILKYMNTTVDPCEDFYNFACGKWKQHHPANETISRTRISSISNGEFNRLLNQMLNSTDNENDTDTDTERKMKNYYKSCLKLTSTDLKAKLLEIIEEFGEMPILKGSDWREEDFDWLKMVAQISHKYGHNIIIGPYIRADWQDRSSNVMVIRNQEFVVKQLGLSRGSYQSIVTTTLVDNLSVKRKKALPIAKEIVDFEFLLYEGENSTENNDLNRTTMQDMHSQYYPQLDVMKLINISYGSIPTGIVVSYPSYFQDVIYAVQTTPKRMIANYIFFHLIIEFIRKTPHPKKMEGDCLMHVKEFFPKIIIAMFYDSKDLRTTQEELEVMWQAVKSVAQELLESDDFGEFDEASREDALEKLHSMKLIMPLFNRNNLDEEYQQLKIGKFDFIENFKALKSFKAQRQRASLEEEPNYVGLVKLSTASYVLKANTIIFPATTLTTDFYWSLSLPKFFNYARLGYLISHEVVHGFTGTGRTFNRYGRFVDFEEEDIQLESCLYEQYHNISYGGKPLPQDNFQNENIADNVGLAIALKAYGKWYNATERKPEELQLETLPSLNYTRQQLFFILYSQIWCTDTLETRRAYFAASDKHSPDDIRSYVPLRNLEAFSQEFNCPLGSAMNPTNRCDVF